MNKELNYIRFIIRRNGSEISHDVSNICLIDLNNELPSSTCLTLVVLSARVTRFESTRDNTALTYMPIKIENQSQTKLPAKTERWIEEIVNSLSREHTRGVDRVRLVDVITDPRLKAFNQRTELPGLYHPRQGTQAAWIEIAVGVLLSANNSYFKRLMPRLSFKGNLAAVIFSLVGQHYYLTLRHSVKKSQVEASVKSYTEKQLRLWHEKQNTFRAKLFKPFQPTLEKWGRSLRKRAMAEEKKRKIAKSGA